MMRPQLIALLLLLASAHAMASDEQAVVVVKDEAFCLEKAALDCNRFAIAEEQVSIRELPRDSDGNSIIHFHSIQSMQIDSTLVHVWETDDKVDRPRAKLYVSDGAKMVAKNVIDLVRGFLDTVKLSSFAVVIRNGIGTSQQFRAYSQRIVYGPGKYTAYVATVGGQIIPNSAKRSITVVE